jgi:stage V sporulation protein B
MSVGILFLGLHQISTGILQGLGKTSIPVINMILAGVVKVVLSWTLTAVPSLGVKGASMATVADFAVAAIINMCFIYKFTGYHLSAGNLLKPLAASGVMGAVIYGVLYFCGGWGAWAILVAMIAAVPSYALALIACGGLHQEDMENIPFVGARMLRLGQRFGYFKG